MNPAEADLDETALEEINREVLASIFWGDPAFISSTLLHGTFSLRLCILNHTTTWEDVRRTLGAIERSGSAAVKTHGPNPDVTLGFAESKLSGKLRDTARVIVVCLTR